MTIRTVCPGCRAAYTVAEELQGKKARCRECQTMFVIGASLPVQPAQEAPTLDAVPPAVEAVQASPSVPASAVPPPRVEVVEADPTSGMRRPRQDDVPRRPMQRRKQKSGGLLIVMVLLVGLFLTAGLLAGAGYYLSYVWNQAMADTARRVQGPPAPTPLPGAGPIETFPEDPFRDVTAKGGELMLDPPLDDGKEPAPKDPPPLSNGQLPGEVLARVKKATVFLRVAMASGQQGSGSGFFALEPGIVVTNAHVVGMTQVGAGKPQKLDVVLNQGERDEKTVSGTVIDVDRVNDLALVRVKLDKQPALLKVKSSETLNETQSVFVFGFPFGEQLGKGVTITHSSVSSLRRQDGVLVKIQVAGGMNPGNSGGPVVDGWGDVVGVSVAMFSAMGPGGIQNTQINLAVPSDYVRALGAGRLVELSYGQPYREGETLKLPVTVKALDPLKQVKKVQIDYWTGSPGTSRPAGLTAPSAQPGDSERQSAELTYKNGTAQGELALPALPKGKTYWLQPAYLTASRPLKWAIARPYQPPESVERKGAELKQQHKQGTDAKWVLWQRTTFRPRTEATDEIVIVTRVNALFHEAVKAVDANGADIVRQYTGLGTSIRTDKQQVEGGHRYTPLMPFITSLKANLRVDNRGEVLKNEIDPQSAQANSGLTELNENLQAALAAVTVPLPAKTVKPGESWKETRTLPLEVAGQADKVTLKLTYTYAGLRKRDGRDVAVLNVRGTARGDEDEEAGAGRATGVVVLDVASGKPVEADLKVQVEASVNTQLPGFSLTGDSTLELRLRPVAPQAAKN